MGYVFLSTDVEVVWSFCLEILSFAVAFRRVDLRRFKPISLTLIRQKATKRGPHHYPITSLLSIEFPKFLFNIKTSLKLENLLQIFFKTNIAHRYLATLLLRKRLSGIENLAWNQCVCFNFYLFLSQYGIYFLPTSRQYKVVLAAQNLNK
jgi:hypothetical protein